MLKSSLEGQIYYFACNFLWDVLSLFHYLNEEIATENLGSFYLKKWGTPYEDLANWTLKERWFLIDSEQVARDEKDLLFSTTDTLGDLLTFHFGNELNAIAIKMHQKYPGVSASMWLYYYYCGFLQQTLTEFDRVLQEPDSSLMYYEHYRQDISLFNDMAKALENERPFLDTANVSEETVQVVWADIDAYASKLGAEWRQAVHSAARDLKLPDFGENAA